MSPVSITGVDPGLVHTGIVTMQFSRRARRVDVDHVAIPGADAVFAGARIDPQSIVFIEDYRPRSHFSTDQRMTQAVSDFRRVLDGTVLSNTGIKKVVKRPLMELLGVWKFATVTHHQDLRSAARIGLLGMLKSTELNALLTEVVQAHLRGDPWDVRHRGSDPVQDQQP